MNSEETFIASHPFIQQFALSIIHNIRAKNFNYEEKSVIHADLVPKVSGKVMMASFKQKVTPINEMTPSLEILPVPEIKPEPAIPKKQDMRALVAPILQPRAPVQSMPPRPMPPRPMPPRPVATTPAPVPPMARLPQAPQGAGLSQDYGKITPLLHDDSVSTINCAGVGKPITIIRAGQKQMTKISLNANEIKEILQKVSDAVHIPLLEGVFRAAVDNFSINAVISEMIGSRFVIKKQNAYALLEQ